MLIRAPWFIYELPLMNEAYNEATIGDCFDTVMYDVLGYQLSVDPGYNVSYRDGMLGYTNKAVVNGVGTTVQEYSLVTQVAGLYHELTIPPQEGVARVWLLLTGFSPDGEKFVYWDNTPSAKSESLVNEFLEERGAVAVEFCRQVAAKFTPKRPG